MSSIYAGIAMLTRLRIEMPQMTKKDDTATAVAESALHARSAGLYRKNLYPKHLIDPITSLVSEARGTMLRMTLPCAQTGWYLIPNTELMEYLDIISRYEKAFWQSVTAFLNNWSNVMLEAQAQQGQMFDASTYPDLSTLKAQFVFDYPLKPIAQTMHGVAAQLNAQVRAQIEQKVQETEKEEAAEILAYAYEALRTEILRIIKQTELKPAINKKTGETEYKPGRIFDTLTGNITELTNLLNSLGACGDPALPEVLEQIDMHLTVAPDALRTDPEVCRITHKKAQDILGMLS